MAAKINVDALKQAIELHLRHHAPAPETLRTLLNIWGNGSLADAAADALDAYDRAKQCEARYASELNWTPQRAWAGEAVPQDIRYWLDRGEERLEEFFAVSRRVMIEIGLRTEADYEGLPIYSARG